jgi:hypothetical protein
VNIRAWAILTYKEDKLIIKEPYKVSNRQSGFKAGDEIIQIGDVFIRFQG